MERRLRDPHKSSFWKTNNGKMTRRISPRDGMLKFMMLQSKRAWKTTFRTTLQVVEEGVNEIAKWEKTTGRKKGK